MKWMKPLPLLGLAIAMFGFGFLLVPLYSVFCDITGINGKTGGPVDAVTQSGLSDRFVTVQFVGNHNANLDWPFKPMEPEIKLRVGEKRKVLFRVINTSNDSVVAQAVPSVAPSEGATYLKKMECFCFQQQALAAGEKKDMPLVFFVDQELPIHIKKLTLSYTLFDMTEKNVKSVRS